MINWTQRIDAWRAITPVKSFPPASEPAIENARQHIRDFPDVLETFLASTNGLIVGPLKMLPVEDEKDIKRTWDSILRANNPGSTRFLNRSDELLNRFIVFAEIGAGRAAAIDRTDGSIWFEDEGLLRQTNLMLEDFVDTLVREMNLGDASSG